MNIEFQERGMAYLIMPGQTTTYTHLTCNHCNQTSMIPFAGAHTVGKGCWSCRHFICNPCIERLKVEGRCITWDERMDRMELNERLEVANIR